MTKFSSVLLAAAALAGTAPALAEVVPLAQASVHHADLNLASAEGVATFRGRVQAAADRACGDRPGLPLVEARAVGACRTAMIRSGEQHLTAQFAAVATVTGVRGTR